jgi:hypothetical protein
MNQFAQTMRSMNEIIGDVPGEFVQPGVTPLPGAATQPGVAPQPGIAPQPQPGVQPPAPVGPAPIDGQQMRQRMRQGLNEFPDAVREARITMQQFRQTLSLADKNLRNLEGFTEPLGQRGEEIAASLIQAIQGLDTLVKDFTELTRALNDREGTIGRLIHDGQVYENLNRLMCNANVVLIRVDDFVKSLRPIRDDVRAFTDKVGREPGRIISGAVNPSLTK